MSAPEQRQKPQQVASPLQKHPEMHTTPTSLIARLEELRRKREQMMEAGTTTMVGSSAKAQKIAAEHPPITWKDHGQSEADPGDETTAPAAMQITMPATGKVISVPLSQIPEGSRPDEEDSAESQNNTGTSKDSHVSHAPRRGQFSGSIELNDEQQRAVSLMCDFSVREFPTIGSAGTGKTTLLRAGVERLASLVPAYGEIHKHLNPKQPAIVVCSYTRRAVRNLKRSLQASGFSDLCITIHKLLEYAPEYYTELNEAGEPVEKMRFSPSRHKMNKLTGVKMIIIDEAGMCSVPLFQEILDAAPHDCRFMFLGDIYQLPPIYGSAILGYKLADAAAGKIPIVELTKVYRQALDSPILRFALQVKDGRCMEFNSSLCNKARSWHSPDKRSSLHVMPIKEHTDDKEFLCHKFGAMFGESFKAGRFDPEQDVILIPHGKPHTFGSYQLNLHIAQAITDKNKLPVFEIIAGFAKLYLCIGDRVAVGSMEGRIKTINRNAKYLGKFTRPPSDKIDRWGRGKLADAIDPKQIQDMSKGSGAEILHSLDAVDQFLDKDRIEDRKAQASHVVTIELEDSDEEIAFSTAGELNSLAFTYALTVHRSQGAEWRNVYLVLYHLHAGMYSRELLYTAMTRAREQLFILARPAALEKCVDRAVIKGKTLAEKAEFFKGKKEEKERQLNLLTNLDQMSGE